MLKVAKEVKVLGREGQKTLIISIDLTLLGIKLIQINIIV